MTNEEQKQTIEQHTASILKMAKKFDEAMVILNGIAENPDQETKRKLWAYIEIIGIHRDTQNVEATNETLKKILALDLKQGDIPHNFLEATWGNEEESQALADQFLKKVMAVEPPTTFPGANVRLVVGSRLADTPPETDLSDQEKKKRREQATRLAHEVIDNNTDINLIFQAYEMLALVLRNDGDIDGAIQLFEEFAKKNKSPEARSLAYLGEAITMVGIQKQKEGIEYYAKALQTCLPNMDCCRIATEYAQQLVFADRKVEAKKVYQNIIDELGSSCWGYEDAKKFVEAN